MAYMRVHCSVCGGTWEVYYRDNWDDDKNRQCPRCRSAIDEQTWRQVMNAFDAAQEANEALHKEGMELHRRPFSFDVIADRRRQRRRDCDTCPLLTLDTLLKLDSLCDDTEE